MSGLRVRVLGVPISYSWNMLNLADAALARNWSGTLERLKASDEWHRSNVAFLGCGSYGLPLAAHAKRRGMSAVYIGGQLQLLFGILSGRAFVTEPGIGGFMNDHWLRRPLLSEIPPGERSENDSSASHQAITKAKRGRFRDPRKACVDCDYW